MSDPIYIVGIDLGTTNSVAAYTKANAESPDEAVINIFKIPQLVDAGSMDERENLPSFVMLAGPNDVPENGLNLTWDKENKIAVGEFAKNRGSEIPHRLISSTKSWLCHTGIDRNKAILPWEGPEDPPKLSPVESSAAILKHIKDAWNHGMAGDDEKLNLENQEVFLTVPASFDAVARELTVKAAEIAGLPKITLLEEPQAAFYAWIERSKDKWRDLISVGDVILVCDVGGGTTDFSLIKASEEGGELALERIAVGNHLLVGGDNIDIALAHAVSQELSEKGTKLDAWQARGLWHSCRTAKEKLFEGKNKSQPITILGRGTSLIGGTIKTKLDRKQLNTLIEKGFFPICSKDTLPVEKRKSGMREIGLSYTADPAVTHHLAYFLSSNKKAIDDVGRIYPTAVLFNGGVMKAAFLKKRILKALASWVKEVNETFEIRELENKDPDMSVACGAAYYGLACKGKGIRIKSGLSKSYYIGIEASLPAVPGMPVPMRALCVAPFGMEEGTEAEIPDREFGLVVGESVKFDFLGSGLRHNDQAGTIVNEWGLDIEEITTLETSLDGEEGSVIPVTIQVKVTEVGTLELWCVSKSDDRKWKLEFNVREQ
ncbi:Nucleotide-binding protein [Candidatus Magnetomoraceae bacterium gMMP-15]